MSEFSAAVEAAGSMAISGGCLDLGEGGPPYAPFAEALRALARRLDAAEREATFGPAADALSRLIPDVHGQAVGARDDDSPDASDRLGRLFDAVLAVLDRASREQPLVLVIEDVQWADGSTRNLVRFLVRNMRSERLLLLATYRSDDLHRRHPVLPLLGELSRAEGAERLELRRFGREELEQQLVGILGAAPAPARIDALLERSDGLPFFVEELVAEAGRGQSQLPATLQDMLGLRLATLSAPSLALVRAAAVVGGRVRHDRLAAASGMDEAALLAALREVVDARILVPVEDADEPAYTFRHALLREAAHDELLPAERVRVHERLADHLGSLLRAGDGTDPSLVADFALHAFYAHDLPRALEGSIRALLMFVDAVAYREALAQAERALELWPRVEDAASRAGIDHADLLAIAGRMAAAVVQPGRAMAFTQQALAELHPPETLEDRDRQVELLADLQWSAWAARDYRLSVEAAERAHALGSLSGPTRLKAYVTVMLGVARWWEGRLAVSAGLLEEAMAIAKLVDDRAIWADAACELAHTLSDLGQGVRATVLIDRSAEAVPEGDRRFDRVSSETNRSVSALTCGRFADAEQFGRLALDLASRYGWEEQLGPHARTVIVDALFELGRYAEADLIAKPVLAGVGVDHAVEWMATTMARVAVARGRFEEAHRLIDSIEAKPSWGEDWFATLALVDLARAEGRFAFVATAVDASVDRIAETEAIAPFFGLLGLGVSACADRAVRARRRRRLAEVEDAVSHAHRWLGALRAIVDRALPEGGAGPWPEAILATAEAEIRRLVGSPDPEAWADVVDRWVALSHPFQTAYTRLRLAEALLEGEGERATAETALRQAQGSAAAIGAAVLRVEVEALAGAARIDLGSDRGDRTGASQPGASVGIPVLTAREQGVLRLVAEGHTNREIGGQLFISEKTASVHVSNAMAKLGALSRYEAAATAERLGLLA
jgi:DNA-binding CsgD family transcriptional regulator/tetratricopeptide (TPR) repeat protein